MASPTLSLLPRAERGNAKEMNMSKASAYVPERNPYFTYSAGREPKRKPAKQQVSRSEFDRLVEQVRELSERLDAIG